MTDKSSPTVRLAVLASGAGAHLQALNQAIQTGHLGACIDLIISDEINAPALQYARLQGLKAVGLAAQLFSDATSYQAALARRVAASQPDWVILDDFVPAIDTVFAEQFPDRVLMLQSGQSPIHLLTPAGQHQTISPAPATDTEVAPFCLSLDRLISAQMPEHDQPMTPTPSTGGNTAHDSRLHNA